MNILNLSIFSFFIYIFFVFLHDNKVVWINRFIRIVLNLIQKMGKQIKEYWTNGPTWAKVLFWIFLIIGTGLIIASWLVPPMGIIDSSVLAAFGEFQGFASIGLGFEAIFQGKNVTLSKGNTQINVSQADNCSCEVK